MRIAMVTTFYPPYNFGGDGIYIERLARSLSARGHDVEVIHDTDGYRSLAKEDPDPALTVERDGVIIHRLRSKHPMLAALAVQQTGRPVTHGARISEILNDRFDVIHYHNISLIGGPGVWQLGRAIKLHTAHEHWLVCPTHVLWRFNRELCDARQCLKCALSYGRPPQLWRQTALLDRQALNIDAFLTFSQSTVDNHRRFGFNHDMQVVPSFLPDASPTSATKTFSHARPYFLCVGRLEGIKGFDQVIHAMRDKEADLLIAGTGDEEATLRRAAQGMDNIYFLGRKSPDELRSLYSGALAVVTPSRCFEVFPLVVLEAFREGTPIIARKIGPFPEIVDSTGAGVLFETDRQLDKALHQMLRDTPARHDMGARAKDAFNTRWSEPVAMERYFAIIDGVGRHRVSVSST